MISIIIPIYNVEKYLKPCLDSVLAQTYQDFEIIAIDDGSFDSSFEILKSYKDKRIRVFKLDHKGAARARNFGLEQAQGEYIQFLDSDDWFEANMLERKIAAIEEFKVDIVVTSSKKVDDNGSITEIDNPNAPINLYLVPLNKVFKKDDFKNDIFSLFSPMIYNLFFKKSFLIEHGINFPPLKIYEDVAFTHSAVVSADSFYVMNEKLINYRFNRDGSLTKKRSAQAIEVVKSCLYLKEFLIKKGIFEKYEKAYEKAFLNHALAEISYCNDTDYKKFIAQFKELMPNSWQNYREIFLREKIDFNYLKRFIGDKKVVLWGASLFLRQLLEGSEKLDNILGIIDKNTAIQGEKISHYTIFPSEKIAELNPDEVILTVFSNNKMIYEKLKEEYPEIKFSENIFALTYSF